MNENPAYKSGFATLIGRPNVGKSTLMNRLIGQKIAITSNKPQTTRNRIQTVLTLDEGQIVFLDTPGIHKAKNKLGDYMVNVAEHTLNDVDVILWLVEPTNFIGAGERHIIEQLKKTKTPVILVINKTDTVKKDDILAFIDTYRKELDFQEIVPVSALKGDNTDVLIQCILKYLPYGPAFYDEDTITDQPMRQIVAELIREKGYVVENIDATIIAQKPKMRPHIPQMEENIAGALGISTDQVNVKATTEEGLGFTGTEEGISSQAICALSSFYEGSFTVADSAAGCAGCGGCGRSVQ